MLAQAHAAVYLGDVQPFGLKSEGLMVADSPILALRGINKSFGAIQVLHSVDFNVFPGEVMALVGDNGAGKSTLVKCVGGIYPVDSGEFLFNDSPIAIHGPRDAAAYGVETVSYTHLRAH